MKATWTVCMCILVMALATPLCAQDSGAADAVRKYFKACREGDIAGIKRLITGPFLAKRKSLLNENSGYSNFLRGYFEGVQTAIISEAAIGEGRGSAVIAERRYPDGSVLRTRFTAVRNEEGLWRIFDEELY